MEVPNIKKIEDARKRKGYSKKALSKIVGIHPTYYTLIIQGKHRYAPTIARIAIAVGLKPESVWKKARKSA